MLDEVVSAPDDLLLAHAQHFAKALPAGYRSVPIFRRKSVVADRASLGDSDPIRRISA